MVLINNLTIDEINAALLHLQRARTEVVGGTKGSTVQNITISNKGGGSTVDYAPTITALSNRVDKNTDDIESVEDEIDKIQTTLEQLSDNGISSMTFDPVTRQLQINTQDGEVYSCDITSENITLNFDATTNKLTLEMGEQYQEVTLPYIKASEKGSANGVATLDSSGRVPYSQLPESAMEFLGNWNASTNTPHLQDGTGTNGDFYVCNVGGTVTFGTGNTQTFVPNDRVIYNGASSQWVKLPAGQVSSVNGMSGDVTLTASNIEYSTGVTIKQQIDANAPVQSDWNVTDTTSMAYIKNKPTIPASPVQSDWNVTDTTSLAYIKNKPATNLVCTCKYLSAYDFDVVLTNTCASQTQYTWVSATCRLRFCSSTGVLKAACFCGTASCATNADTVDGYHADVTSLKNLIRVTRESDVGSGANGYYAGMANFNADGSAKWWHILSMDWSGNDATHWQSQFILPTQQGGVPKYRRNNAGGTAITSSTWHNFITDENISTQHVACACCATCISGEYVRGWDWIGACARIYRLVGGVMLFQIHGNTCQGNIFEAFCRVVCSRNLITTSDDYHYLTAMGTATTLNACHYSISNVHWYEDRGDMCLWEIHGPGAYVSFRKNSCCVTTLCYMSFIMGL